VPMSENANRLTGSLSAPVDYVATGRKATPWLKWQRIWPYLKVWTRRPVPVTGGVSTFSGASRSFTRCEQEKRKKHPRSVAAEQSRPFSGILASARRWFRKAFALELAKMRNCNGGNRPTVPVTQSPLLTTVIRKRDRVVEYPGYLD
jgi:hypothetical protein